MITIKIGKMPGTLTEVALEDGSSVKKAAEVASLNYTGYEPRINGQVVSLDTTVRDGQTVLFVQRIKGNSIITVKAGKMPGTLTEVAVESGTKVAEVLRLAGLTNISGYEVRMSGAVVSMDALVATDGAQILLVQKIKGNK